MARNEPLLNLIMQRIRSMRQSANVQSELRYRGITSAAEGIAKGIRGGASSIIDIVQRTADREQRERQLSFSRRVQTKQKADEEHDAKLLSQVMQTATSSQQARAAIKNFRTLQGVKAGQEVVDNFEAVEQRSRELGVQEDRLAVERQRAEDYGDYVDAQRAKIGTEIIDDLSDIGSTETDVDLSPEQAEATANVINELAERAGIEGFEVTPDALRNDAQLRLIGPALSRMITQKGLNDRLAKSLEQKEKLKKMVLDYMKEKNASDEALKTMERAFDLASNMEKYQDPMNPWGFNMDLLIKDFNLEGLLGGLLDKVKEQFGGGVEEDSAEWSVDDEIDRQVRKRKKD